MHEFSIVQALLEQCEELALKNSAKEVTKVVIKIGVLSGVESQLLQTAFETFKEGTVCHNAYLDMKLQEVVILCETCQEEHSLEAGQYHCPNCDSTDVRMIDGEAMMLMQLEMQ